MSRVVPQASIAGMIFTLLITLVLPVVAAILTKRKTEGRVVYVFLGAGTFVVFALALEQLLHIAMAGAFGEKLTGNMWLYALYGGLAAGLFEETGRFVAMRFLMKKHLEKENALMYGIGHGAAEGIILSLMAYIPNLVTSIRINNGSIETALSGLDAAARANTMEQLQTLWTTGSDLFFMAGIERLFAFILQICLSYIVYLAVKNKKPVYYFLAVLLHFLIDAGIEVLQNMVTIYFVEAFLIVTVLIIAVFTVKKYRSEQPSVMD